MTDNGGVEVAIHSDQRVVADRVCTRSIGKSLVDEQVVAAAILRDKRDIGHAVLRDGHNVVRACLLRCDRIFAQPSSDALACDSAVVAAG